MKKGGTGGAKTKTGAMFERIVDIRNLLEHLSGYEVVGENVSFRGTLVANLFKKGEFYRSFLKQRRINDKEILSSRLYPDEAVFVIDRNTLYIIEKKYQQEEGSVDEKLQTCDFKKKQYERLLANSGVKVELIYILNDWFRDRAYRDTLTYMRDSGCHVFFEQVPPSAIGLPSFPDR